MYVFGQTSIRASVLLLHPLFVMYFVGRSRTRWNELDGFPWDFT